MSKVTLISSTPDALKVAFAAIRTCYSTSNFSTLWNDEFDAYSRRNDDHIRLLRQITRHGHQSTLEHISFTFAIEGVSRACLAQLTRHRLASYSVRSQRYVKGVQWAEGVNEMENEPMIQDHLQKVEELYEALISVGYSAEDARMILPNQAATNLIMTINLRSFFNLWKVRRPGTHAQHEIAALVESMKDAIVEKEPWVEDLLGVI